MADQGQIVLPDGSTVKVARVDPGQIVLPDGSTVKLVDWVNRQIVLPLGTVLRIPATQEWVIHSLTVLPGRDYTPPGFDDRDPTKWGDVEILVNGRSHYRANILTLMDRYWGRYVINPDLPLVSAQLESALSNLHTAPRIPELAVAIEKAKMALVSYMSVASPSMQKPIKATGGVEVSVVASEGTKPLDVELLVMIRRDAI